MKTVGAFTTVFLALAVVSVDASARAQLSPVTRVVELLEQLSTKIQAEAKTEEGLYEEFVCWGKTVIESKTASNAAAQAKIAELETYIADLDAGRIELTSERKDLEKQIEGLLGDIEAATEMRNNEHNEFLEAEDEMNKAIDALNKAIDVLKTATEAHESGVLLSFENRMREGFAQRTADAAALHKAIELGEKFLTKGDSRFLSHLLTGDVPTPDWKKLNRKADFKMSYKARSFKIQEVLAKLLSNFNSNLQEATAKENEAQSTFETLMASKNDQKNQAQEALNSMLEENGAKGLSKEEAQSERDNLEAQVQNDQRFISETQQALEAKKAEWKTRQEVRASELAAISKAISILRNDDSRDLFKKSFASQTGSFLQVEASTISSMQRRAADALKEAARKSHDPRLLNLARTLSMSGAFSLASSGNGAPAPAPAPSSLFQPVIEAIDSMLSILTQEATQDLQNKEACESERATDARSAVLASREIDEMSDAITALKSEIEQLNAEISDKQAELAQITADITKAGQIRDEEKAQWTKSDADDQQAAAVVEEALGVLQAFYSANSASFAQKKQAPAGQAPPPPPTTWEAPYSGKTEESQGILSILTLIKEDIEKDRASAKSAEDRAAQEYLDAYNLYTEQAANLNSAISELQGEVGTKEEDVVNTKGTRATKKGELDVMMKKMKDAEPGCNFITVNFDVRTSNRQAEIDGLQKAKAILQGAVFTEPADESRELKPGDAFLQRIKKH